jgi:hypothetical protein
MSAYIPAYTTVATTARATARAPVVARFAPAKVQRVADVGLVGVRAEPGHAAGLIATKLRPQGGSAGNELGFSVRFETPRTTARRGEGTE